MQLKIALRSLSKNRLYTMLNLGGLALGIATCLGILLFVHDEWRYDRFHTNAERIVRVVFRANINGGQIREPFAMPPTARALKNDYPEVQDVTRLRNGGSPVFVLGERVFRGKSLAFVDENFFRFFTLPLRSGDAHSVLNEPNTVVLSQKTAAELFGNTSPIGQVMRVKNSDQSYRVTGVMQNIPANSHFQFDVLASTAGLEEARSDSWMQSEFYTYLLLPEGYDYKQLEAKLPQTIEKYMGPQFQSGLGMSLHEFQQKGNQIGLYLQALTDIHLHSDFSFDLSPAGNAQYLYLFSVVALFMLLIACINFMNLSTAAASARAREVGVRKALGSSKSSLLSRFLSESVLLSVAASLVAMVLLWLSLPFLNALTDKSISMAPLLQPAALAGLGLFTLLTGLLSGIYPAFFMSAYAASTVLKGSSHSGKSEAALLRNALVVFQFFISSGLIFSTLVVRQQLSYIQHKKLGYDKNAVLVLNNTGLLGDKAPVFREQLLADPRIGSISCSGFRPVGPSINNNTMLYPDGNQNQLMKALRYEVDAAYIPTLGMKLLLGRNFSAELAGDSSAVIVNEAAARAFGWGQNAIGHRLTRTVNNAPSLSYEVIGMVEDFHFKSLHERITPLVMVLGKSDGLILKTATTDLPGLLASIQAQWAKFQPDEPLEYAFMDEMHRKTYLSEERLSKIFGLFSSLTIFIACLGLFGLAAYSTARRSKELGIRKVLGASVHNLVLLLSKDFLRLVLLAVLLASPLSYYAMNRWLADFAYRIELQGWMFGLTALAGLLIALLPVGYHSLKAARENPVKVLG